MCYKTYPSIKKNEKTPHTPQEYVIYEHGTHFVFSESMLKTMLPVGSGLFVKLAFQAARKYPEECRRARLDIDRRVRNVVAEWKSAERDGTQAFDRLFEIEKEARFLGED